MRSEIVNNHLKRSILNYGKEQEIRGDSVNLQIGRQFQESLEGAVIDEFRIFNRELSAVEVAKLYGTEDPILAFLESENQQDLLEHYLQRHSRAFRESFTQLTALRGQENRIYSDQPEVMVMEELKEPRPTFILDRGAYDAPTKRVYPTTPVSVMEFPKDLPRNRLGLAQWLIDEDNPLTARVAVNRYWQLLFGRGLVKTIRRLRQPGRLTLPPRVAQLAGDSLSGIGLECEGAVTTTRHFGHLSAVVDSHSREERKGLRQRVAGPRSQLPPTRRDDSRQRAGSGWFA